MNTNSIEEPDLRNFWEKNEPDFINPEGVKWWLDRDLTRYATRKNMNGTTLDYQVFIVKKPNGYMTRIILDEKREPIFEDTMLEGIGCKIDMCKLIKEKCDD